MHERARHGKGNAFTGLPRRQHLPPAAFVAALIYVLVAPGSSQAAATGSRPDRRAVAAGRHEEAPRNRSRGRAAGAVRSAPAWEIESRGEVRLARAREEAPLLPAQPAQRPEGCARPPARARVRPRHLRSIRASIRRSLRGSGYGPGHLVPAGRGAGGPRGRSAHGRCPPRPAAASHALRGVGHSQRPTEPGGELASGRRAAAGRDSVPASGHGRMEAKARTSAPALRSGRRCGALRRRLRPDRTGRKLPHGAG